MSESRHPARHGSDTERGADDARWILGRAEAERETIRCVEFRPFGAGRGRRRGPPLRCACSRFSPAARARLEWPSAVSDTKTFSTIVEPEKNRPEAGGSVPGRVRCRRRSGRFGALVGGFLMSRCGQTLCDAAAVRLRFRNAQPTELQGSVASDRRAAQKSGLSACGIGWRF